MAVAVAVAVAVFKEPTIQGDVLFVPKQGGVEVRASFTHLPPGLHGFHIHSAGDLRGKGCHGLCDHFDKTKSNHGGSPDTEGERHTGDLGNIEGPTFSKTYFLNHLNVEELFGRSVIVHDDEDDLGQGHHDDSKVTGHSGARIGCAIIGRVVSKQKYQKAKTRRLKRNH